MRPIRTVAAIASLAISWAASAAELPDEIAAKGETIVFQVHAVGAQIYECKTDTAGRMRWQFREPIATLLRDGKTVGRHYAGPTWEIEGNSVVGKIAARALSDDIENIPWLKLDATDRRGDGPLKDVTTIQRINTEGGTVQKELCDEDGALFIEPYAADYVFLKKP
jgi:hypothetical protein